ncbi:MAG: hypothetical protein AAF961_19225, partial [Planctomycetota bacterium]
ESLKRSKAELDRQLREQFGARLKGWEIRGWTKSGEPRSWQLARLLPIPWVRAQERTSVP